MVDILKKLTLTPSVSGREDKIREVIKKEADGFYDEAITDNMGNLILHKKGNGKKVMACAHMDEIGFFVTYIEENGTLCVSNVGGINFLAAAYAEVVSENGVYGVIVPEANDEVPKADTVFIDIGVKTKKQAEKLVSVGDFFVLTPKFKKLNGTRYIGRPFDNRVGCYVLLEALKQIKTTENDLYFVFSTQEEVGLRGSRTAAYNVNCDIGIAVDVTSAKGKPLAKNVNVKLGDGATIKIKDASAICSSEIIKAMHEIAKEENIKVQNEILIRGGTDTASMQVSGSGAKTGAISIPSGYIHTGVEIIDMADVKECIKLLKSVLEKI